MSARATELLEWITSGTEYLASVYDADVDIASPKQFLVTTGAKKCNMLIRVKSPSAATIAVNKTVIIGSAGGASVGTAVTVNNRDQASTNTALTTVGQDYVVGSGGGASAGSAIITEYHIPNGQTVFKFKLEDSSVYGLIFTTIADNNLASFHFEFDEK